MQPLLLFCRRLCWPSCCETVNVSKKHCQSSSVLERNQRSKCTWEACLGLTKHEGRPQRSQASDRYVTRAEICKVGQGTRATFPPKECPQSTSSACETPAASSLDETWLENTTPSMETQLLSSSLRSAPSEVLCRATSQGHRPCSHRDCEARILPQSCRKVAAAECLRHRRQWGE